MKDITHLKNQIRYMADHRKTSKDQRHWLAELTKNSEINDSDHEALKEIMGEIGEQIGNYLPDEYSAAQVTIEEEHQRLISIMEAAKTILGAEDRTPRERALSLILDNLDNVADRLLSHSHWSYKYNPVTIHNIGRPTNPAPPF